MPNESDFDFPIVELENDSPQAIGKGGLFDYFVTVPNTGITFVAAIAGVLYATGVVFPPASIISANLRAASTLAQMGLLSGNTLTFLRTGAQLTQAQEAAIVGVPLLTYQAYEAGTLPVPLAVWKCLAFRVTTMDGRYMATELNLSQDFRARLIRIFPNPGNVPGPSTPDVGCVPKGLVCAPLIPNPVPPFDDNTGKC